MNTTKGCYSMNDTSALKTFAPPPPQAPVHNPALMYPAHPAATSYPVPPVQPGVAMPYPAQYLPAGSPYVSQGVPAAAEGYPFPYVPGHAPAQQPVYPPPAYPPQAVPMAAAAAPVGTVVSVVQPVPGKWTSGLFDCLQNFPLSCFACWCGCFRWAQTLHRSEIMRYSRALGIFLTLLVISGVAVELTSYFLGQWSLLTRLMCSVVYALLLGYYRGLLRQKYQIEGSSIGDFCTHFWCACCGLVQEARYVDAVERGYEGGCEFSAEPLQHQQYIYTQRAPGVGAYAPVASYDTHHV
eukprot:Rmarinus@m.19918